MSNKTPTPIQQAIEDVIKHFPKNSALNYKQLQAFLNMYLPAERKFAEECFDAGFNRSDMDYISFDTFYKNNYEDEARHEIN